MPAEPTQRDTADLPLLFVVPVYEDWPVLAKLLSALDTMVRERSLDAEVLVIDDGSSTPGGGALRPAGTPALRRLRVLELRRNLGHQRALAVAFAWAHENAPDKTLVVLDGDGEDDPADVPALLDRFVARGRDEIVFAARRKRSESALFQVCYRVYQVLHRLLTGRGIRVGNYSVVPPRAVSRLAVTSETWSHYAAAVIATGIPHCEVPTDRAQRLGGRSKMSFTSLVVHGLSALAVYSHLIGVRLLVAVTAVTAASAVAAAAYFLAGAPAGLHAAPPAVILLSLWLLVLLQAMAAATLFVFVLLSGRQSASVVPLRDYRLFVAAVADCTGGGGRQDGFRGSPAGG